MATLGTGAPLSLPRLDEFADRFREWMAVHDAQLAPLLAPRSDYDQRVEQARGLRKLLSQESWGRYGWPEGVGGLGGTILHRGIVYEELFRVGWTGPAIFEHLEIIAPTLARFAEPGFAARVLPDFLDGSKAWAQGFSEPQACSRHSVTAHPGGPGRRRVHRHRLEDLDELVKVGRLVPRARAHGHR